MDAQLDEMQHKLDNLHIAITQNSDPCTSLVSLVATDTTVDEEQQLTRVLEIVRIQESQLEHGKVVN